MQTLTLKDLARILNRSPATIATEVTKSPHKLPPRLLLPGSRRVMWLQADVENWMAEQREISRAAHQKIVQAAREELARRQKLRGKNPT